MSWIRKCSKSTISKWSYFELVQFTKYVELVFYSDGLKKSGRPNFYHLYSKFLATIEQNHQVIRYKNLKIKLLRIYHYERVRIRPMNPSQILSINPLQCAIPYLSMNFRFTGRCMQNIPNDFESMIRIFMFHVLHGELPVNRKNSVPPIDVVFNNKSHSYLHMTVNNNCIETIFQS